VGWVPPTADQATLVELVQEPGHIARVQAQALTEGLLAQRTVFLEQFEGDEVPGPQAARRSLEGLLSPASEVVVQQGQRLIADLSGDLSHS
jgi:hypothetical protein